MRGPKREVVPFMPASGVSGITFFYMTDLPNEEPPAEPMEAYRWAALGATELVLLSGPP